MAGLNLHLILASLRRQKMLYGTWILSLCLAVTGLVIIDVYRQSLGEMILQQGRRILTADLALSANRLLRAEERAAFNRSLPEGASTSEVTEMIAMVSSEGESRLASLKFIDRAYPLVGELLLAPAAPGVSGRELASAAEPSVWVAPDLLIFLRTEIGGRLKIGAASFRIAGTLHKDSSQILRLGPMAPRIYVALEHLPSTKLVQFGSTLTQTVLASLPTPAPPDLRARLEREIADPAVEVTVPKDIERGALRVLSRILDYLGLIGLVTLSLGWVGVYYLGRRWLTLERAGGALLKCLGWSNRELLAHLLLKLGLILICGVALGGVLSWAGAHAVLPLFKDALPAEFVLIWSWRNTALLLAIGPLAGLLLLFSPARASSSEPPLALFNANPLASTRAGAAAGLALAAASALLFFALTFLQARSWQVTWVFLAAVAGCTFTVAGISHLALRALVRRRPVAEGWRRHLVVAQWSRRAGTSVLVITVSALAGLLAQFVPHMERTLVGEIRPPGRDDRPALFLFDVQEEQVEPLRGFLDGKGARVSQTSPFIRSRLLQVNGREFERGKAGEWSTREEETEARFRNRGVNLSYRPALSPSEKIVAGKSWDEMAGGEVSVERGYAERLGFAIGDRLLFDVQGVEIEARVVSLREVDWDSFEPNFFVQFRVGGVLAEAPKTWIMTVRQPPGESPARLQRGITAAFSNVSSVNVAEALDNATALVHKLGGGLRIASGLAMALGIYVFLMVLLFQLSSSRADWIQLRVMGLSAVQIWQLQLITYGGLALIGTLMGTGLAAATTWAVARFALKAGARFDLLAVAAVLCCAGALSVLGLSGMSIRDSRRASRSLGALSGF